MPVHRDEHRSARMPRGIGQRSSEISANAIFIGCNFGNRRVKKHFDGLKRVWESTLPVRVYLSDKVSGQGAEDLWNNIEEAISEANLAIFDVTSFRPNVVLELGFALALKDLRKIVICRDLTPSGRANPEQESWLLSDIGHLRRKDYRTFRELDECLINHINRMSPVKKFYKLISEVERSRSPNERPYIIGALEFLAALRDDGPMSRQEFRAFFKNRRLDPNYLKLILVRYDLAKPATRNKGIWMLVD